jgi:hypothetical protein
MIPLMTRAQPITADPRTAYRRPFAPAQIFNREIACGVRSGASVNASIGASSSPSITTLKHRTITTVVAGG